MVEVGKFGDKTIVIDSRYISVFKAGKLLKKYKYMIYLLPDGYVYLYRRPISITEKSGKDLTDYQVKIVISGDDPIWQHARSAGEDIRFCRYAEEQMLSYWIEKYDSTNKEAIIWVKVPSIPANSTIDIFMYYGNEEVTSKSDGVATFVFFDDFDDLDISDYTIVSGSFDVVEEPAGSGNGILKGTASGVNLIVHNTANVGTQKVVRAKVRPDSDTGAPGVVFGYQDSSNFYHVRIHAYEDQIQIYEWVSGSASKKGSTSVSISPGTWYILEAIWKDANTIEAKLYDVNGNLLATATATMTGGFSSGKIGLRTYNPSSFDDFCIRNYTEPEPEISVGAEE